MINTDGLRSRVQTKTTFSFNSIGRVPPAKLFPPVAYEHVRLRNAKLLGAPVTEQKIAFEYSETRQHFSKKQKILRTHAILLIINCNTPIHLLNALNRVFEANMS